MRTNPVQANTPVSHNGTATSAKQNSAPKPQSAVPQDKVTISAAAQSKQAPAASSQGAKPASHDVDHDGDKK